MYYTRNNLPGLKHSEFEVTEINAPGPGVLHINDIKDGSIEIPYLALDLKPDLQTFLVVEKIPSQNLTLVDICYGDLSKAGPNPENTMFSRSAITNSTRYCLGALDSSSNSPGSTNKIALRLVEAIKRERENGSGIIYEYDRGSRSNMDSNVEFSTDLAKRNNSSYNDIICFYQTGAAIYKNVEYGVEKTHIFHRYNYLAKDKTTSNKLIGDCFYVFESSGRDLNEYLSNPKKLHRFVSVMLTPDYLRDTRGESLIPCIGGYDTKTGKRNNGFAAWEIDSINRIIGRDFSGKGFRGAEPKDMGR